jgi:flavin-dependent dehydrogenase
VEAAVTVAPTLDAESAARRVWDIVVVGAGPAGSMAARELARRGAAVLLVDRAQFPRYKVCGGCLNPRSLHILEKSGLGDLMSRLGAVPLTNLRLATRGSYADISLPTGAGVSRELLDASLSQAAIAAGSCFLPGASATLLPTTRGADRRILRLRHAGRDYEVASRIVLAANGLGGKLEEHADGLDGDLASARPWEPGSRVGAGVMVPRAPAAYEPGTVYMACAADGYVGQVVVEDGRVDMAAALDPLAVKAAGGAGELSAKIIAAAGFPEVPDLARLPLKGTPHLTRQAPRLGGERLFVLGDAAGYVEPFTGEGMAWALAGATLVTPLALRGASNGWDDELLVRWRSAYHRSVSRRQIICRITAGVLRRPRATRETVRVLSVLPWLARLLTYLMYRD